MMLTEEQAREKWCPFSRAWGSDGFGARPVAANRYEDGTPTVGARCIASPCMAWRWAGRGREEIKVRDKALVTFPKSPMLSHARLYQDDLWIYDHDDIDEQGPFILLHRSRHDAPRVGYCGLAGRPAP